MMSEWVEFFLRCKLRRAIRPLNEISFVLCGRDFVFARGQGRVIRLIHIEFDNHGANGTVENILPWFIITHFLPLLGLRLITVTVPSL